MNNSIFEDGDIEELLNDPNEKAEQKEKKKAKPRSRKKTTVKNSVAKVAKKAAPTPTPAEPTMPVAPAALKPAGKIRKYSPGQTKVITIQKERGVGGDRPVAVCYNGKQFTVPRGVRVTVPAPIAEILMNAEETIMEWVPDKNMIESRAAASYPTAIHD